MYPMYDPAQLLSPEEFAEKRRNELDDKTGNNGEPIKEYPEDDPREQR